MIQVKIMIRKFFIESVYELSTSTEDLFIVMGILVGPSGLDQSE